MSFEINTGTIVNSQTMNRYEFMVLLFLFALSDYYVINNHILWTLPYNFKHYNSDVFQDFSIFYYYALHGKYSPKYSDYDVTTLWTYSGEQYFHEFFYYAMFGKYRPFLFYNIL